MDERRDTKTPPEPIPLHTGALSAEAIDLLLSHLPVDLTFVDETGHVRYFSNTPGRIFKRSPGIIGRHVTGCHPPSSVDKVEQIVGAFERGEQDRAEFWIQLQGRFIYIRYFAVRDAGGAYRGTLEVSQDITELQKLAGEKRLLDWGA
ncbi:MAG: DUF438 domain-containing protein [Deltaproteobacteria bacterium]|nr:DUF438 domain-containing protein [Deltaproteobacteria bacterium]